MEITDEDWRNREKWDAYEQAVNEMLVRTSTTYAPWTIIEGNSKYFRARQGAGNGCGGDGGEDP